MLSDPLMILHCAPGVANDTVPQRAQAAVEWLRRLWMPLAVITSPVASRASVRLCECCDWSLAVRRDPDRWKALHTERLTRVVRNLLFLASATSDHGQIRVSLRTSGTTAIFRSIRRAGCGTSRSPDLGHLGR